MRLNSVTMIQRAEMVIAEIAKKKRARVSIRRTHFSPQKSQLENAKLQKSSAIKIE